MEENLKGESCLNQIKKKFGLPDAYMMTATTVPDSLPLFIFPPSHPFLLLKDRIEKPRPLCFAVTKAMKLEGNLQVHRLSLDGKVAFILISR